jgi:hypothetical protein
MANGRATREIKRVRNETLVALRVLYPASLQADKVYRSLLVLFPTLEFDHFKRDLHYLCEKGYVERMTPEGEDDQAFTPWRRRWFRLTTRGIELAERCVIDPALDES